MQNFRQRFLVLIDEIRRYLGYSIRQEDLAVDEDLAMEMTYGGFSFSIVHSARNAPEKILIECIYGNLPEKNEQVILVNLLEMNSALAEIDGSIFCIDGDTDQLIYTLGLEIESLDAEQVLRKMTEIVWHGKRWKKNYFLNIEENSDKPLLDVGILA